MKANRTLAIVFALYAGISAAADSATPTVSLSFLTQDIASRIVVAAIAECTKRGYKVSASVVGRDGSLMAFLRSPLAGPHTILVSQRKAYTAASLQAPTSKLQSRQDLNFAPGLLLVVGGVPICAGGMCLGAAAVAGADPVIDEKCAEAGIASVQDDLELAR
jgi:uncharacterized protein GlcG (DUF336 family)